MIQWCAYCQRYVGEIPPWDNYSMTHTICPKCEERRVYTDSDQLVRPKEIADFYTKLRHAAKNGNRINSMALFQAASLLEISPIDLMIGMIQPILHEVGDMWAKKKISVADEHKFSAFSNELLTFIYFHHFELDTFRQSLTPQALLISADGNYHTLGIQLLELALAANKIATFTVTPGIPSAEILALIKQFNTTVLCISVALPTQLRGVRELLAAIRQLPLAEQPKIYLGGMPVRDGLILPARFNITLCQSIFDLPLLASQA